MVSFYSSYATIERDFEESEIDIRVPGFYDHPNFLRIEQSNPEYLSNYARFVCTKNYTEDYINRARNEIPTIANALHRELVRDGRLGACVDISMSLSKMLEREGYWNYIVKGALTINFPQGSGIKPQYFWPIDYTEAKAGHAWVVAPPFSVIDISIKQQPYSPNIKNHIPEYVITETSSTCSIDVEDILPPQVRMDLHRKDIRPNGMLESINPTLPKIIEVFEPLRVVSNGTTFKYITCAISASDGKLEDIKTLCLNGLYSHEIFEHVVRPCLNQLRLNTGL